MKVYDRNTRDIAKHSKLKEVLNDFDKITEKKQLKELLTYSKRIFGNYSKQIEHNKHIPNNTRLSEFYFREAVHTLSEKLTGIAEQLIERGEYGDNYTTREKFKDAIREVFQCEMLVLTKINLDDGLGDDKSKNLSYITFFVDGNLVENLAYEKPQKQLELEKEHLFEEYGPSDGPSDEKQNLFQLEREFVCEKPREEEEELDWELY